LDSEKALEFVGRDAPPNAGGTKRGEKCHGGMTKRAYLTLRSTRKKSKKGEKGCCYMVPVGR